MATISNNEDILDSRDILERIGELIEGGGDDDSILYTEDPALAVDREYAWERKEELELLQRLIDELTDNSNGDSPEDGITLIRDSYFEEYAEEFASDIGAISRDMQWPLDCIDWGQAAKDLQQDYFSIEFDGVEYWYR